MSALNGQLYLSLSLQVLEGKASGKNVRTRGGGWFPGKSVFWTEQHHYPAHTGQNSSGSMTKRPNDVLSW